MFYTRSTLYCNIDNRFIMTAPARKHFSDHPGQCPIRSAIIFCHLLKAKSKCKCDRKIIILSVHVSHKSLQCSATITNRLRKVPDGNIVKVSWMMFSLALKVPDGLDGWHAIMLGRWDELYLPDGIWVSLIGDGRRFLWYIGPRLYGGGGRVITTALNKEFEAVSSFGLKECTAGKVE